MLKFALSAFLFCIATCAADPYAIIETKMKDYIAKKKIAGSVTLVIKDGKEVHHGVTGLAEIATNKAMTKDSLFRIASLTKTITATAIMMLHEEGKLNVDDPVSKTIPSFANCKLKDGTPVTITIRHLLTHTAGIGRSKSKKSIAAAAESIAEQAIVFQPGSKWKYSEGITVCGRIIEIVSGKDYNVFLKERIFDPLGMNDTTFFPKGPQVKRIALCYAKHKNGLVRAHSARLTAPPKAKSFIDPSGGLFSTSTDLGIFYQMILDGGVYKGKQILSKETVKQMVSRQTADDITTGFTPGNGWGLGWCVVRKPQGVTAMLSPTTYGAGGNLGPQAWVDPKTKTIYLLMIQRIKFGNSDGSDVRASFQQLAVQAANSSLHQ